MKAPTIGQLQWKDWDNNRDMAIGVLRTELAEWVGEQCHFRSQLFEEQIGVQTEWAYIHKDVTFLKTLVENKMKTNAIKQSQETPSD